MRHARKTVAIGAVLAAAMAAPPVIGQEDAAPSWAYPIMEEGRGRPKSEAKRS